MVNELVNLQEVGAQVNRVGNAVGIHSGALNIVTEEWQKLVAYIGPLLQDVQAKERQIAELTAKVAALEKTAADAAKATVEKAA